MTSFFEFTKVLDVKNPNRGTSKSAGIDFFIPNKSDEFIRQLMSKNSDSNISITEDGFTIFSHKDVLIPSGIHYKIPENTMLMAANKSGVATKLKLVYGAEIGDEDYEGQFHLHLINTSGFPVSVSFGQKIIQAIIVPILYSDVVEKESLDDLYHNSESSRGQGGFGSTGIH